MNTVEIYSDSDGNISMLTKIAEIIAVVEFYNEAKQLQANCEILNIQQHYVDTFELKPLEALSRMNYAVQCKHALDTVTRSINVIPLKV